MGSASLNEVRKRRKSLKIEECGAGFWVFVPFLVIEGKGCGMIRESRLIICDLD